MTSLLETLKEQNAEFAAWRRYLHQNPETAFEEKGTSDFVAQKLESFGIEVRRGLARTGVVGIIKGKRGGKMIGLRADMDALNMPEETNLPYASKIPGKMHACGHDGHTATLLAAAKHLAETRDFAGTVVLIFQPAEEDGGGGNIMIEEGFFKQFPCDAVFGLHNWPNVPAGKIALVAGPVSAACDDFNVTLTGVGGHAARPHKAIDVILCAGHLFVTLQQLVSRVTDPKDSAVLSICNMQAGSGAHNVLPRTASFSGTLRTMKPETRRLLEQKFRDIVNSVCAAYGATAEITWRSGYPPTINTPAETEFARKVAMETVGAENVIEHIPAMGGEDFSYFLEKKPGCYIILGGAKTDSDPGLHSTHFDYNDDIIPVGAAYWINLAEKYLK